MPAAGRICAILLAISPACTSEDLELTRAPAAFAGFDAFVVTGEPVALDGSASSDPEGDALAFRWRIEAEPEGSSATIADVSSRVTAFTPQVEGVYVVSLAVSDGAITSRDLVTFSASAIDTSTRTLSLALDPLACNADFSELAAAPCADGGDRLAIMPLLDQPVDHLEWTLMRVPPGVDAAALALEQPDGPLGKISFAPPRPGEYWISARSIAGGQTSQLMLASVAVFESDIPARDRPLPQIAGKSAARPLERVFFDARASEVPTSSVALPVTRRWGLALDPSAGDDSLVDLATGCPSDMCRVLFPSTPGVYVVTHEIERGGVKGATALHALEVR